MCSLTVHDGKVAGKEAAFDTLCLHAGYTPDPEQTFGIGQGAPRGVPLHRTGA